MRGPGVALPTVKNIIGRKKDGESHLNHEVKEEKKEWNKLIHGTKYRLKSGVILKAIRNNLKLGENKMNNLLRDPFPSRAFDAIPTPL